MPRANDAGFTLLELMVTVAVLAILAAIALPNFQGVLRANRVATASNDLLAALSLARSEAIKNTHGAGVCASTAGTACDGATWAEGWLVWADTNGNQLFDGSETVLKYTQARTGLLGNAADDKIIAFDGRGRRRAAAAQQIHLYTDKCGSQPLQNNFQIGPTGQVTTQEEACP